VLTAAWVFPDGWAGLPWLTLKPASYARNVPQRGTTRTRPSPASTRIALVMVDRLTP